jgi:hypothetical protein
MTYQASSRSSAAYRNPPPAQSYAGRPHRPQPAGPQRLGDATARFAHYLASPLLASGPLLFGGAVIAALYASWLYRDEGHLTPENGLGYAFGITGSVMMLALLLYPLRKRWRALRGLGRVPSWFRIHMIFGILGPSLILVHSNWKLSSFNATVATMAMLIVVGSGIVGRYLYSKVHQGLYGRKTEVRQILTDASLLKEALGGDLAHTDRFFDELRAFEARILARRQGLLTQTGAFVLLGIRQALVRGRLIRLTNAAIAAEAKRRGWSWGARRKRRKLVREHLGLYFAALTKAARFGVYERMFALWHVLHLPLFVLLVAAAILHIVAVHLY